MNPQNALQEIFNASEQALLTGPQRDRIRSQAQALNAWIAEQMKYVPAPKPPADEPVKPYTPAENLR